MSAKNDNLQHIDKERLSENGHCCHDNNKAIF